MASRKQAEEGVTGGGRAKLATVVLALAAITAVHWGVSIGTHGEHVVHVVFRGLYLLPIVAAALWFGWRGGLLGSTAAAVAYSGHVLLAWRHQPMENANQAAMIAVFLFVGAVAGVLVERQERERWRRLESERRAQRSAIVQALAGLSNALAARDEYTREHSERVSRLAVAIGVQMALAPERLELLRLAALMHDVGKIGIRDDVLFKPDELTPEERARVERHPALAADILRPIRGIEEVAEIVLSHHECPDGSGYPRGLRGEGISVEARIVRVADVFAALTDARPYKPAQDAGWALARMEALAGTKLDRDVLQALRDAAGQWTACCDSRVQAQRDPVSRV